MIGALAFLLALAKLLLGALIVWGLILFLPLDVWFRRMAQLLLLLIVIFAVLLDAVSSPTIQGSLPYPLNPSTPDRPSIVR